MTASIIYLVVAITMWICPSLILLLRLKASMIIGGLCNLSFVSFCYFEISWLTYLGCAITGFGAALSWAAQATYLTLNSETGKMYRSIGIFWMIFEMSFLTGNLFIYYRFSDSEKMISSSLRGQIVIILMSFVALSVLMLCGLRRPLRGSEAAETNSRTALDELKKLFHICTSKKMMICFVSFSYCGIHLTYMSVIAASIGFSKHLSSNSKSLAPLSGIFQGIGEIIGCSFSLHLNGRKIFKLGLIPIASLVDGIAYIISFLGLPEDSNYTYTNERPLMDLSINYLLLANVLIGIGDACIHIEIYNFIGTMFPNDSTPGFAIFKFGRCLGTAISFYYSNIISLHSQLLVLIVLSLLTNFVYNHMMPSINSPTTVTQEIQKCKQPTTMKEHYETNA